ncbi:hypothetical protein ACJMK2_001746 [Sinanodonta woodiana]|uniref:SAM domain-containing protein n=1 Tax=Sinanodonta woodiana TaxID=1069815 RepID=A0ABD3XWC0_SINWO
MSDVFEYDESKQMTLKELYKKHDKDFPLLIIIMEGYCGETHQETFETFQVLRIHCSTNQRRVVAKTAKDVSSFNYKFYSIPVDYRIMFKVVKGITSRGNMQTMAEILDENKLPVLVKLGCEGIREIKVGCSKYQAMTFGNLLITKEYIEHFYLCNCISSDLNMFTTSVLCALSENMSCCVITGFRNRPRSEFQAYLESLNKQLVENNVTFDKNQGFPEFAEFTIAERSMETGAGGAMSIYAPLVTLREVLPEYEEQPPPVPQRHVSKKTSEVGQDDLYEILDPNSQTPPPVYRSTRPQITSQMTAHALTIENNTRPQYINTAIAQAVVRPLHFADYTNRPLPPPPEKSQGLNPFEPVIINEPVASELPKATTQTNAENITEHEFHVRDMKINDVASALESLKLEKYKPLFESALVDGMILSQLKENDFQKDFGFTRIEAIRLTTFVRTGHIPK